MSYSVGEVGLPEVGVEGGDAEGVGDGEGFGVVFGGYEVLSSGEIAFDFYGENVGPGVAGIFAGADGLVDGKVEARPARP